MLTTILAGLAVVAYATAKLAEARGRSADEKMGSIPFYLAAFALLIAAGVSYFFF